MMKVQGGCYCGAIRFEAEVDPQKVNLCNCNACQVLTGSAYRVSVPASAENFKLLSGTPSVYVKTADSGNQRALAFCATCGTPLYGSAVGPNPPSYTVRVGTLAQRALLPPQVRSWCESALAWAQDVSQVPARERQ